jgi:hypothetical protein
LWRATHNRHDSRGREDSAILARVEIFLSGDPMSTLIRSFIALGLALSLTACAAAPPPPPEMSPPPKKCIDAKSQLETGRKC